METSNIPRKNTTVIRMALMLVAAIVIGLAYNSATPLGVIFAAPKESPPDAEPAPSVNTHRGFENQIIKIAMLTDNASGEKPVLVAEVPRRKNLTWSETEPLLASNEIVLIDARDAIAYQTEHIPGAISLPIASSDAERERFASKYPRDTALVIYCNSSKCPMAGDLAFVLRTKYGYTNIHIMPGGFAEYRATRAESQR